MKPDTELFYAVAVMYYQDGLNQQDLAERMNLSRPMVSRILAKAQECGIVRISVVRPEPIESLSSRLEKVLGIEKAYVAPTTSSKSSSDARVGDISDYASQILVSELRSRKNIGVGWGSTVYRTVMKMVDKSVTDFSSDHNIVPIVGSVGVREVQYQVNIIVSMLAHVLGGSVYFYNSAEASRKGFEEKYRDLFAIWDKLDAVLFGLGGSPSASRMPYEAIRGDAPDYAVDVRDAVGDLLGQFFTREAIIGSTWEADYLNLSAEKLKKVGRRICLCGGSEKVDSLIAAAGLGLYNVLVTDTRTAEEIINKEGM